MSAADSTVIPLRIPGKTRGGHVTAPPSGEQAELAAAAGLLSSDLEAIQAQIDHCLALWRELRDR